MHRENTARWERIETRGFAELVEEGRRREGIDGEVAGAVISLIASRLDGAPVADGAGVGDALRMSLIRAMSAFVYYRFIQGDPGVYVDWRLGRGDRFRDREVLLRDLYVAADAQQYFGEPLDERATLRETFVRIADHHARRYDSSNRIVGLSLEPEGMIVGLGIMNPGIGYRRLVLGDELVEAFWYEPELGSNRCWFESGIDFEHAEGLRVGTVGVIVEFADGSKGPMLVVCFLEPTIGHWSIEILQLDCYGKTGGLIEF